MKHERPVRLRLDVSDPWEFQDENGGRWSFDAKLIGQTASGDWVLSFAVAPLSGGRAWNYGIAVRRFVRQKPLGSPGISVNPVSVLFIEDSQARSEEWLSTFDSKRVPETPWIIGALYILPI